MRWDIEFCVIAILKYEPIYIEVWVTSNGMLVQKEVEISVCHRRKEYKACDKMPDEFSGEKY
jgi:hypothetical protein